MKKGLILSAICCFCTVSFAGLKITPIQMFLNEKTKQRSSTVMLDSVGLKESKIFEMSAVKWTQDSQGKDLFEKDDNILINPKNFVIKPDSKQIIRVGFAQPVVAMQQGVEKTWRIIFTEIAPVSHETSVNFLFNISVPFFVGHQDEINLDLKTDYKNNHLSVWMKNKASSHVQILKITVEDQNKKEVIQSNEMKYLLSGVQYTFNIGHVNLGDLNQYRLKVTTDKNDQPIEFKL